MVPLSRLPEIESLLRKRKDVESLFNKLSSVEEVNSICVNNVGSGITVGMGKCAPGADIMKRVYDKMVAEFEVVLSEIDAKLFEFGIDVNK